jgi:glutathione-regulated potassium-efflux system ancillary protein KefG
MRESDGASATYPKILVIFAHPEPQNSVTNQLLLQTIRSLGHVTIRDLYAIYPDFFIDITAEQQLLLQHDVIVFQHPLYMYSCPALLKEWFDRVLCKDFAFGARCALKGKVWRNVITTGGKKAAFDDQGYNRYPLEEILHPFELTASLCRMKWVKPLILYWSHNVTEPERFEHAEIYRGWLCDPLTSEGTIHGSADK